MIINGEQDDLFLYRVPDHSTSIEAAEKVEQRLSELMTAVLGVLRSFPGGLTDSELRSEMIRRGWQDGPESTYRKRRTDLATLGLVIETGERRENERGSREKVWVVAQNEFSFVGQ